MEVRTFYLDLIFVSDSRAPRPDQFTPGTNYGMFYDLGVYGTPGPVKRRQKYDAVKAMRAMEKYVFQSISVIRNYNFNLSIDKF